MSDHPPHQLDEFRTAVLARAEATAAARDARSALDVLGFSREPGLQEAGVISRLAKHDHRLEQLEQGVADIVASFSQERRERRILYAALTLVALLVSAWIVVGFVDRAKAEAVDRAQVQR